MTTTDAGRLHVTPSSAQSAPERRTTTEERSRATRHSGILPNIGMPNPCATHRRTASHLAGSSIVRIVALMSFILTPSCLVGCASHEEDAADVRQPSHDEPESSEQFPVTRHESCDGGIPLQDLSVTPLAGMNPVLHVDPFHLASATLGMFFIENRADHPSFIELLSVHFGDLCAVLETVGLVNEDGAVMSDGACAPDVEFVADTILGSRSGTTFGIIGVTRLDLDAAIAAIRARERDTPEPGVVITGIFSAGTYHPIHPRFRGGPIRIRDTSWEPPMECAEFADDSDTVSFGAEFIRNPEQHLESSWNQLFIVPFRIMEANAGSSNATVVIRVEPNDVTLQNATLATENDNAYVNEPEINGQDIIVTIPSEILTTSHQFRLYLQAPGIRTSARFVIEQEGPQMDESMRIGCYPNVSDPYLLLPRDEWEELP